MKYLFLIFLFFNLTGCYTIHFIKDKSSIPEQYTYSTWHHIGLLGLMEFSDPVNLTAICGSANKWNSVKVQTGFLQGLIRMIVIPVSSYYNDALQTTIPVTVGVSNFYSPEEVSISCK